MYDMIQLYLISQVIFILVVFQVITLFFTLYQLLISLLGMIKRKKNNVEESVGRSFAILVCAHNERYVIGDIVRNLVYSMDYPKELYDVYVIADNCTDQTAEIARENGAIALERYSRTQRGKGYAIEWALDILWKKEHQYDSIVIFDADNLVTSNFLKSANAKMDEGFEVIQAYLDSKNPGDTWITKSYALAYWSTNVMFQLAREKLKISAQLGGTGMIFSSNVLKEMGWGAKSLTEDLEFTVRYALVGGRVGWLHTARIYDEKPLRMKQSYVQRLRWMKGHLDCAVNYFFPLLRTVFKGKNKLSNFDVMVYLIMPSKIILALSSLGLLALSLIQPLPDFIQKWIMSAPTVWVMTLFYYVLQIGVLVFEKKAKKILWIIPTFIFSISWIPIMIQAAYKRKDRTWSHTKHTRTMAAEKVIKGGDLSA